MHLWTEYEGRTIAEHYTLGKLLRSEGRNGFFATADKDGHPAVIRLTEAHFDEAEQLERWRHVAEVHQDNLIEIEQVGQTTFEGVALTYALMEPEDANLGDVLKERPLTSAETLQVARAVLGALKALHASGLVHEHIEPNNVLAVGETVKLRSDCVRECVPDGEFNTTETCADLRRRDLHDYGTLLLRCLTLETEWVPAHNNLPDPFKRLIPRALDGTWSLEQLTAVLEPTASQNGQQRPTASQASALPQEPALRQTSVPPPIAAPSAEPGKPVATAPQAQAVSAKQPLVPLGVRQGSELSSALPLARDADFGHAADRSDPAVPLRTPRAAFVDTEPEEAPSRVIWLALAAVVALVLWLGWHFFLSRSSAAPTTSVPVVRNTPTPVPSQAPPAEPTPAPVVEHARPSSPAPAHAGAPGWYVIAFTYNHEEQAANKVQHMRRTHNSLHPEVFTPTGHAPYFVALGGAMSQNEAEAVYRHARRSGLPRDTFVRHY